MNSFVSIPNIITLARLLLVLPFLFFIYITVLFAETNIYLLIIFLLIIISDILDGYLARKLKCTSLIGAKLDIIADSLYSILSIVLFTYFQMIPIWFPFILIIKLCEFTITTKIVNHREKKTGPVFDKLGKVAASAAMLLPGVFVFRCIIDQYVFIMSIMIYFITALFLISLLGRISTIFNLRTPS